MSLNTSKALNRNEYGEILNKKILDLTGYKFKNSSLLVEAMTHGSFKNESKEPDLKDNQKLEFLGDAVLELSVSKYLYKIEKYALDEGALTKNRAALVCEESFSKFARKLKLDEFLILSSNSKKTGINKHDSVLSDAFEALFGAIFLDSDFDSSYRVLIKNFEDDFGKILKSSETDFKSELNEFCSKNRLKWPEYQLDSAKGPEHDRDFFCTVLINSEEIAKGSGKSIKNAEKEAAEKALKILEKNVEN